MTSVAYFILFLSILLTIPTLYPEVIVPDRPSLIPGKLLTTNGEFSLSRSAKEA